MNKKGQGELKLANHSLCIFSRKLYLIGSPAQMIYDHAKTLGRSSFKQDCDSLINAQVKISLFPNSLQTLHLFAPNQLNKLCFRLIFTNNS
jgi:hypothetical protein